jgi:hypothetical protein
VSAPHALARPRPGVDRVIEHGLHGLALRGKPSREALDPDAPLRPRSPLYSSLSGSAARSRAPRQQNDPDSIVRRVPTDVRGRRLSCVDG